MTPFNTPPSPSRRQLDKVPTGIQGLDQITRGGLPKGRPTLVCGGAGCAKTLLAMEFIVRGATEFDEPGVFMSFEETVDELTQNVSSLGFDLSDLIARKQMVIDLVRIETTELEESGEYDLEGLFIRLGQAIDSIGAKRVALDTMESLFAGLSNPVILRAEMRRLFRWLKDRGVTAVITGESGREQMTRQGLEDYVSDCVILLDHRVKDQVSSRLLRVVKYRGSLHGTNEYPFLISNDGISVTPVTSLGLQHIAPTARVSTGIQRLDAMLGGEGYYRGSSVLVSGVPGTGKSCIAAHFVDAACRRGERALYFAFEESANQIIRNMRSIGIELEQWVNKGLLQFHAVRPTSTGLESHLLTMQHVALAFQPEVVVVDPLNSFVDGGSASSVKHMLVQMIDFLKSAQITGVFTHLNTGDDPPPKTDVDISSLIDTWLLLRIVANDGERNRTLSLQKSRGMAHSNQIREFLLTDNGVDLLDVYVGPQGVLTGSARATQEAQEKAASTIREGENERRQIELERKRKALKLQIAAMRAEFDAQETELLTSVGQEQERDAQLVHDRARMGQSRKADVSPNKPSRRRSK